MDINRKIAQAYLQMQEGWKKGKVKKEAWVPESIADEDVADFMGAAAAAAKAGKKEFKFGDKTYKVTMKKSTAKAIEDAVEICEKCGKVHEGSCNESVKEEIEELDEASVTIPDGADGMDSSEKREVTKDVKKTTGAKVSFKGNAIIYSGNKKQIEKALAQHFPDAKDDGEEELLTVAYWKDEGLYKESVNESLINEKVDKFEVMLKNIDSMPRSEFKIGGKLNPGMALMLAGYGNAASIKVLAKNLDKFMKKSKLPTDIKIALAREIQELSPIATAIDGIDIKEEALEESPEQPRAKGEKDFKKMHDDNTEIVDEKDGEEETFDNIKKSADAVKK